MLAFFRGVKTSTTNDWTQTGYGVPSKEKLLSLLNDKEFWKHGSLHSLPSASSDYQINRQ